MPPHRTRRSVAVAALGVALTVAAPVVATSATAAPPSPFAWSEATMAEVRTALVTGRLTCTELVRGYLDRIAAYDRSGPRLQSVISVSSTALDEAAALDAGRQVSQGRSTGALHCVPLLLKDNIDVAGMPTTAGATALAGSRPPDDAFVAQRLKAEGAIVLGKANLDEFAFGFGGTSAVGGLVRNPYVPAFGAGGSSAGTGAAVAASLAMAGLGTDTGGSIRVPSSVNGLVGIRPSMRLLSQDGIVPLSLFQDTAGPMCRVVEDCATLLDVLAGFDPAPSSGQYTLPQQRDDRGVLLASAADYDQVVGTSRGAYAKALKGDGLAGARIGVVRALFGTDPAVLAVLDQAIAAMREAGATVEDVVVPDLSTITGFTSMSSYEFKDHLERYLQSWPSDLDGHPRTYAEVQAQATTRAGTFASNLALGTNRYANPTYQRNTLERPDYVRPRLTAALDNTDLAGTPLGEPYGALLYPSVVSLPRSGAPNAGSNNRLSPYSGFPALSMPAGFTPATPTRPALPVGMELLGREFDEATLLGLAHGYQESVAGTALARQAPTTTPELPAPVLGKGQPPGLAKR